MKLQNSLPNVAQITAQIPTQILVISDIHLGENSTAASRHLEHELSKRFIELASQESAIAVLNGDIFELWAGTEPSVKKALKAHPDFTKSLQKFAQAAHHQVIFVVGNHDGRLAWDQQQQDELRQQFSITICLSAEIVISTPRGKKKILFEHGHMLDPDNAFTDPRDPNDKPFGQYIVQQALPMVTQTQGKLLEGIEHLADPHRFAKFVASRLMYREIFNRLWWLLVPLAITLVLRLLIGYGLITIGGYPSAVVEKVVLYTELAIIINVIAILVAVYFIVRKLLTRAKTMPGASSGVNHNEKARHKAKQLCDTGEYIGLMSGHTHRGEVTKLEKGFYANSGCGTEMIEAAKTYVGLPKTYVSRNHLSWLELDLNSDNCKVVLYRAIIDNQKQTSLEKLVTKKTLLSEDLHQEKSTIISY